jgi:hypothetical protein
MPETNGESPYTLTVGSLDYIPGTLDTAHLRPAVAAHHAAVAVSLDDHAERCVLDILAASMHHSDFTYNIDADLVKNLAVFVRLADAGDLPEGNTDA